MYSSLMTITIKDRPDPAQTSHFPLDVLARLLSSLSKIPRKQKDVFEMDSNYAFAMGTPSYGFDLRVESGRYQCAPSTFKTIAPGYPKVTVDDKCLAGSRTREPEVIEVWQCS